MTEPEQGGGGLPAVRWAAVCLPPDEVGRRPWAVWDRLTDRWISSGPHGEVDLYFDRHGAQSCIRRLRYLAEAGIHPIT
ncbi:hypothetical protein ACIRBX_24700 [Kitasatospora sp. NPDC096147]|uniref:hypothetical protein n=1 Tax=Kitasatospora sp. NPDC096147 TaxID=3364093 RepID=UPI00381F7A3A